MMDGAGGGMDGVRRGTSAARRRQRPRRRQTEEKGGTAHPTAIEPRLDSQSRRESNRQPTAEKRSVRRDCPKKRRTNEQFRALDVARLHGGGQQSRGRGTGRSEGDAAGRLDR